MSTQKAACHMCATEPLNEVCMVRFSFKAQSVCNLHLTIHILIIIIIITSVVRLEVGTLPPPQKRFSKKSTGSLPGNTSHQQAHTHQPQPLPFHHRFFQEIHGSKAWNPWMFSPFRSRKSRWNFTSNPSFDSILNKDSYHISQSKFVFACFKRTETRVSVFPCSNLLVFPTWIPRRIPEKSQFLVISRPSKRCFLIRMVVHSHVPTLLKNISHNGSFP